ncbi:MAG: PBP1A family penicillin-binding protein [Acidobacteriota bacterium]
MSVDDESVDETPEESPSGGLATGRPDREDRDQRDAPGDEPGDDLLDEATDEDVTEPESRAATGGGLWRTRLIRWGCHAASVGLIWLAAAEAGRRFGLFLTADQPDIRKLQDHDFALASKVQASNGQEIYSFAIEKRDYVTHDKISPWLIKGLIATEDEEFFTHKGLNFRGIARAAITDAKASWKAGKLVFPQGGSSITQQLAKQLYLSPEKKLKRKLEEALLALQIEKNFRKEEILEMYLNQVFLGHQRHGVEAAAQYYFGKSAADLDIPEGALIAGLPQRPSAYSPRRYPERAIERRNHVLRRMHAVGDIDEAQLAAAVETPLVLATSEARRRIQTQQAAPYFVEEIRRELVGKLGDDVNTGGLNIETTLDLDIQAAATRAIRNGLRELDKRVDGFRPVETNVLGEVDSLDEYEHPLWLAEPEVDGVIPGLVMEVYNDRARVKIGKQVLDLEPSAVAWTKKELSDILEVGDLVPVALATDEESGETRIERLEQDPPFEAALIAIDVVSGEIQALVGGYDYSRSEFNKATQAKRQAGSAFKPLYFALAMEAGLSPGTSVMDEPTAFVDAWTGEEYKPKNYERRSFGRVTLRTALARSMNISSVRLLNQVGYDETIEFARRCGISSKLKPYPSLALGAMELTLLEIASAYTIFPNQGLWVEPTLIRSVKDAKGNIVLDHQPEVREVLSPEAAFQTVHMMRGVVQHGTAKRAKKLDRPVGGKTGTTDDYSDAWFVGFTPSMVVGVWVGYEKDRKSICKDCSGGTTALPIWVSFMQDILKDRPPEQFVKPSGIEFVAIDRQTGLRATESCNRHFVSLEAHRTDRRLPTQCSEAHHQRLTLPQCLQRFDLDRGGLLIVDDEDLLMRLEEEAEGCNIVVDPIQREISIPYSPSYVGGPLAYRLSQEVYRSGYEEPSLEDFLRRDPKSMRRGDLRDLDILEGRTVLITRNDSSAYR